MIDAYVVRDPRGKVIGLSVYSINSALSDAQNTTNVSARIALSSLVQLGVRFIEEGDATVNGYTLKREKITL